MGKPEVVTDALTDPWWTQLGVAPNQTWLIVPLVPERVFVPACVDQTKVRFVEFKLFCLSAENLVDGIYLMIQTLWFFQQLGSGLVFLNHSIPIKTIKPVLLLLALKHPSKKMLSDSETVRPRERR